MITQLWKLSVLLIPPQEHESSRNNGVRQPARNPQFLFLRCSACSSAYQSAPAASSPFLFLILSTSSKRRRRTARYPTAELLRSTREVHPKDLIRREKKKRDTAWARWSEGPRVGPQQARGEGTSAERPASTAPHAMKKLRYP